MPKAKTITDAACRAAKNGPKIWKLSENGLQLWVMPSPSTSRLWRFAYTNQGRQKALALGAYPVVSLKEARDRSDQARRQLRDGIDPCTARKQAKRAKAAQATFDQVAAEYLAKLTREGRAPATLKKNAWIVGLATKPFGNMPLADITTQDVHAAIKLIEDRGNYDTAKRFKTTIGAVFRFGMGTGRITSNPTDGLERAMVRHTPNHRAAITDPQVLAPLLRAIDNYPANKVVGAALKLLPLLFVRPGELRQAKWAEFDFVAQVWTIPAHRAKMRRIHKVPLPSQAVHILQSLRALRLSDQFVFPSVRSAKKPISDGTMNVALKTLGYGADVVTPHGFRATATTLLVESNRWNRDAINRQLAHAEQDAVWAAYARNDFWSERVAMMTWWADYLDRLKQPASVLALVS